MRITDYGPGDEITWGPVTNHPLDPRNSALDEFAEAVDARADELETEALESFEAFQQFDTWHELLLDERLMRAIYGCIEAPGAGKAAAAAEVESAFRRFVERLAENELRGQK